MMEVHNRTLNYTPWGPFSVGNLYLVIMGVIGLDELRKGPTNAPAKDFCAKSKVLRVFQGSQRPEISRFAL